MNSLKTVYTSNIPINCHIIKGRLNSEGIVCHIFDENLVWVHPFKAVAIGGVKLKVQHDKLDQANKVLSSLDISVLIDENGEYNVSDALDIDFKIQSEILKVKSIIRKNPDSLEDHDQFTSNLLTIERINEIIEKEKEFQRLKKLKLNFTFKQFFYELFDFDRSVFKYLRIRPTEYYIEKEIVDVFDSKIDIKEEKKCPYCNSDNIHRGHAIDYKWDLLYLLLSLILSPLPPIRKNFHCFECGKNFRKQLINNT